MSEADDEALGKVHPLLFGAPTVIDDNDETPPSTDTPPRKVHTCQECGTELAYGGRGRPPVFCDEHKPKKHSASSGATRRTGGTSRAEREAKQLAQRLDARLSQAALMLAPFDSYDGMAIYAMRGPVVEQFEGVMVTHDTWRASLQGVEGTGSVAGLIIACFAMALPILAHHGIIPATVKGYPLGQALTELPKITLRLQRAAETGEEVMQEYLARMAQEERERKQAKNGSGPVNPTEGTHE